MAKRKDVHRPGLINPAEYEYLFSFSYPTEGSPGCCTGLLQAVRTGKPAREPLYGAIGGVIVVTGHVEVTSPWGKLPFADVHGGGCDICGASFNHGDLWRHVPTGQGVMIGHICAGKMDLHANRGTWTLANKRAAAMRKDAKYQRLRLERDAENAAKGTQFLNDHQGLGDALEVDHYLTNDLRAKLAKWGSLSDAQVALAHKIAREAAEPKADEPAKVMPPTGRATVEGAVLSTKDVETDFGTTTKMLVHVDTPDGAFRVFGTVPSSLWEALSKRPGGANGLRGERVRFAATIQPKEPGFGFFSRPTAAVLVGA